jgi:hypothetical protein
MTRFLAAATICLSSTLVFSAEFASQADVEELYVLSGFERSIADIKHDCVRQLSSAWGSPASTAKRGEKFYGRSPSSSDWANILRHYEEYAKRACSHPPINEWKQLFISFYSANLSKDTFAHYRKFLQSPQGRDVVRLQLAFYKDWVSQMATQQAAASAGAYERFLERAKLTDN